MNRFTLVILTCLLATAANADSITLRGTRIRMNGVQVTSIEGGVVEWLDGRGRTQERLITDVSFIGFDGQPAIDEAQDRMATGADNTLVWLQAALLACETDTHRAWVRYHLVRAHDLRREGVAAAGHFAALLLLDDDPYWEAILPISDMHTDDPAVAAEAVHHLERAKRQMQSRSMQRRAEELLDDVRPVHERLRRGVTDPPDPSTTVSGRTAEVILRLANETDTSATPERIMPTGDGSDDPATPPVATPDDPAVRNEPVARTEPRETIEVDTASGADAESRLDELLDSDRADQALAICDRVALDPGPRDLARFLYQHGRAFAATQQPDAAALRFTRAALLFPESAYTPRCFIETAIVYRDVYDKPRAARRLLERAVTAAARLGREEDRARAETLWRTLESGGAPTNDTAGNPAP